MLSLFRDLKVLLFYSKAEFIRYIKIVVVFDLLFALLSKFVVVNTVFLSITVFLQFSKMPFSLSANVAVFRSLLFVTVIFFGEKIVKRRFSKTRLRSR